MTRSIILGCGGYLPEKILTNDDLSSMVETDDAWIKERTGIAQRHIVADGQSTSDLAFEASKKALANAGVSAGEVDLIVVATTTPDNVFPSTASKLQAMLGAGGAAFDVQAVCSGFIYALATADNFIRTGQAKTVLVVGAEAMSRIVDWTDRATCILFGDGAGALVLRAGEGDERGVLSTHLHSDGNTRDLLYVDGGPGQGTLGSIHMEGREVFKHAVSKLAACTIEALEHNGLSADDVDWVVPHQANARILQGTIKKLGVSEDKLISTVAEHANTSAASIPLALATAAEDGRIQPGQLIAMQAIGGGLAWGSALVRW